MRIAARKLAIACLFANLHLTELDRAMSGIDGLLYFRYADDFLMIASRRFSVRPTNRMPIGSLAASGQIFAYSF